jgi:Xaa-Pro aminopeptidase
MATGGHPIIPRNEYPKRWKAVQQMMREEDYDLVVAFSDDKATAGAAHARYLAGFPPHFEAVCTLIPPDSTPHLLTGPESEEYARIVGAVENIHVLKEFTHPDEDYPYATIHGFREIIERVIDLGEVKRIGVGGSEAVGWKSFNAIRETMPSAEWLDAEAKISGLRGVKTAAEIAVIREAYKIAEKGMEAALAAVAPGATEREVAAEAEYVMRKAGAEGVGIDTIVASGPNNGPILARTTRRKIGENDLVLITLAPRYEGYHGAIGRPVVVGDPGEYVKSAVEVAYAAQRECQNALRPGIEGATVEAIGRRIMEGAGLGSNFLYSGIHSVGVVEFEPPIFGPGSSEMLSENMVVSVDIPVFNAPWGGLRVEDGYLITKNGCEKLNKN